MALSHVASETFNFKNNVVTLKSGSEVTHGYWKRYHSIDYMVSCYRPIVT